MVFDAREHDHSKDFEPFEFVGLDGETYQLPHAQTLTERQAQRIQNGEAAALLVELNPAAAAAVAEMPLHVSQELGFTWLSKAGESGKSRSASSATPNADKPSKPTSPSGAST